jgi:2-polyprenyl-6-methoxyphenol hydroxylase-like FAD-dependent oxidoreductase
MKQNAVVLGGSVAGLLAAAALSARYNMIEIVERDVLPDGPRPRRGVPQGQHVHALLPRGLQAIEELLPGFAERLLAAGACRGDVLGDARWYLNGRLLRRSDVGLAAISASRALVEHVIRDSVRSLPNVQITDGHDIVGLTTDRAVLIVGRDGPDSRLVPSDLVVDATGRGSRMPRWLAAIGYQAPDEEVVDIDVRYSSRIFAGNLLGGDVAVITARYPGQRRSSVMQRLEGGRVLVTLAGVHGERPPADLEDFAAYAATLPVSDTSVVVEAGTPIGDAVPFHFPAYIRRHYERVQLPPGVIVIGDAACAFNPVYGQGMSTAAMSAVTLRDDDDPQRFHARQAELHDAPWTLAVGADKALDAAPDAAPDPRAAMLRQLQLAAADDGELAAAFIRVTSLVDPPQALGAPWIAERLAARAAAGIAH